MELWDAYDENRKPLGYTVRREKFDSLNKFNLESASSNDSNALLSKTQQ